MTSAVMLEKLGLYLGDPYGNKFKPALKLDMLNDATRRFVDEMIYRDCQHRLHELDTSQTDISLSSGTYNLSGLTTSIYDVEAGISQILVDSGKYPSRKISFDYEKNIIEEYDMLFGNSKPRHYIRGTTIYFLPTSCSTMDIHYLKTPTTITESVACNLDARKHEIIVGLACENFNNKVFDAAMIRLEKMAVETGQTDSNIFGDQLADTYGEIEQPLLYMTDEKVQDIDGNQTDWQA